MKNPKNEHSSDLDTSFTHMERENLHGSGPNFALGDILDVFTDANFGNDRLGGFRVTRSQILGFSIGFHSRPYNTLALLCKCMISWWPPKALEIAGTVSLFFSPDALHAAQLTV